MYIQCTCTCTQHVHDVVTCNQCYMYSGVGRWFFVGMLQAIARSNTCTSKRRSAKMGLAMGMRQHPAHIWFLRHWCTCTFCNQWSHTSACTIMTCSAGWYVTSLIVHVYTCWLETSTCIYTVHCTLYFLTEWSNVFIMQTVYIHQYACIQFCHVYVCWAAQNMTRPPHLDIAGDMSHMPKFPSPT